MDQRMIDHYQALVREPSIASQLPWVFENGNRWEASSLHAQCQKCHTVFSDNKFTGRMIPHSAHMVTLDAIGYCETCKIVTTCHYRLYDDHHYEGKGKDGRWMVWSTQAKPWWQRWSEWWRKK